MDWSVARPHPALRGLVARYIGYRQENVPHGVHRGLPSRYLTLVIGLDAPIRITRMPRPEQAPAKLRAMVGGMHTGPALIAQEPVQEGLHLEIEPLGARRLLGVGAAELTGYVVDLADLGSPRLAELPDRLASVTGWPHRFAILDEVFRAVLTDAPDPAPELDLAWRRMLGTGGLLRVGSLAAEVGWSRRHFGEIFRREVGLSPKQAARVLRFERAGAVLRRHGRVDLAELAVHCGYYDQAHLSNEWRALAGCAPGTWIAEELPFLQDDEIGRERTWGHD